MQLMQKDRELLPSTNNSQNSSQIDILKSHRKTHQGTRLMIDGTIRSDPKLVYTQCMDETLYLFESITKKKEDV